jgi:hypothetical protein
MLKFLYTLTLVIRKLKLIGIKKVKEVNTFIKNLKITLLAILNYKHSLIENTTKEPIIKTIGFNPVVFFLVIPE